MKERMDRKLSLNMLRDIFGRYKYVLAVILAGALLLLIPASKETEHESEKNQVIEEEFSVDELENQLEEILSEIEGSGRVKVMLTTESGTKRIFAQDAREDQESDAVQRELETVVVSSGSGIQEAVLVQKIYPKFQGALVVAEGGGDPSVRLKLTEAVAALTGLGADKISVCKGK